MGVVRSVAGFIRDRKGISILVFALGLFSQLLTIAIPVSIGKYYELAFDLQAQRLRFLGFIPDSLWNTVPKYIMFLSGMIVLRFAFYTAYQTLLRREAEHYVKSIKDRLFGHQLHIDPKIYKEVGFGKFLLRYSGDIRSVKNVYLKGGIGLLIDILVALCALFWLASLSWKGTLLVVAGGIVSLFAIYLLNKRIERISLESRNRNSGQLAFVNRTLAAIKDVVLNNRHEIILKRYGRRTERVRDAAVRYGFWDALNNGFITFAQYIFLALVLLVFYRIDPTVANTPNLIGFILLYLTIKPMVRSFLRVPTVYKLGRISFQKLNRILGLETEDLVAGKTLTVKNPRLVLESFAINGSAPVSLTTEKRAINVLTLPVELSGLSFIESVLRVNDVYSGAIVINGSDLRDFSRFSIRAAFGVASAQIPLSGRTVYEAVAAARTKRIKKQTSFLFEILRECYPKMALQALSDPIGENGSALEPLDREALCLLRGVNNKRCLILIDEFQHLDPVVFLSRSGRASQSLVLILRREQALTDASLIDRTKTGEPDAISLIR